MDRTVLVLAPIGRDALAAAEVLRRSNIQAEVCPDIASLVAGLDAGAGTAFVAEEGLVGDQAKLLTEWVANQEPWSDFPFIVLTSHHVQPRVTAWREAQMRQLGNVSLIERPLQPITLVSVVQSALRARRRQREISALLDDQRLAAARLESLVDERTAQLLEMNAQLRSEMEERARVEDALRHAQKMDALGKLTGGVAHDFNNLLMVITAGIDMLERHDDEERCQRISAGMKQAAQRGASLTRQLLSFSRSHALRQEVVDVPTLITQMRDLLNRSLRGDIHVKLELSADTWPVYVDPGELEIAILNLCVNARDAMDSGGMITISACNAVEPQGHEQVRLAVSDTGTGMTPEVKARVFDPFFTTKEVGKGSGLGLAQVYGFARQSGGSVEIESEVGAGSTITLNLPRAEPSLAPEQVPEIPRDQEGTFKGSVLLVEDDAEVASMILDMLDSLGFEATHAKNAASALGALGNDRVIDLVLSDIMMPGGMNGIELSEEMWARRPGLPIILSSGFADAFSNEASRLGIRILAKPYCIQDLRSAIERIFTGDPQRPSQ